MVKVFIQPVGPLSLLPRDIPSTVCQALALILSTQDLRGIPHETLPTMKGLGVSQHCEIFSLHQIFNKFVLSLFITEIIGKQEK